MNRICKNCSTPLTTYDQKKYCSSSCAAKCGNRQRVNKKIAANKELIEHLISKKTHITLIINQIGVTYGTFKRAYPDYCNSPEDNISVLKQQFIDRVVQRKEKRWEKIFESIRQTGSCQNENTGKNQTIWLKRYLIQQSGERCSQCNWAERNPITNNIMIEIDHIDGDNSNNTISNVRLLCPNCHSLTPTYRFIKRHN